MKGKRRTCDGLDKVEADLIQLRKTRLKSLATEQKEVNFPNADGTVALLTDIPVVTNLVTTDTTQNITGAKTFSKGTLSCTSDFYGGQAAITITGVDGYTTRIYHQDPTNSHFILPDGGAYADSLISSSSTNNLFNKDLSSPTNTFPNFFTYLTTPHIFTISNTITAGSTQDFQISGNGTPSIPISASAVLVSVYGSVATSGGYIEANRQGSIGALNNNLFLFQASSNGVLWGTTAVIPLNNTNGQISFRASGSNVTISGGTALGYFK